MTDRRIKPKRSCLIIFDMLVPFALRNFIRLGRYDADRDFIML